MVNLVPELELIIGEQPAVPSFAQTRNGGSSSCCAIHRDFRAPEHPLTLFLDDLQWLDAATLDCSRRVHSVGSAAPDADRCVSRQRVSAAIRDVEARDDTERGTPCRKSSSRPSPMKTC